MIKKPGYHPAKYHDNLEIDWLVCEFFWSSKIGMLKGILSEIYEEIKRKERGKLIESKLWIFSSSEISWKQKSWEKIKILAPSLV